MKSIPAREIDGRETKAAPLAAFVGITPIHSVRPGSGFLDNLVEA
jgi:hypothetical protein